MFSLLEINVLLSMNWARQYATLWVAYVKGLLMLSNSAFANGIPFGEKLATNNFPNGYFPTPPPTPPAPERFRDR